MALPKGYQQDVVSQEMALIQRVITLRDDIRLWAEKYGNSGVTDLGTADIQEVAAFEHLTAGEVTGGKATLDNVAAAVDTNRAALVKVLR